jgi:quercetin dioxygenase-like cupin family protein
VKCIEIFSQKAIKAEKSECCIKTKVRSLTTNGKSAEKFDILLFEMAPSGYSPIHKHPSEHQIFVLHGVGAVFDGEKTTSIQKGDVISIGANELHRFKNTYKKVPKLLCSTHYVEE